MVAGDLGKRVQMLWRKQKCLMLMAVLILSLSVFFLEAVPKGNAVQAGRLIMGSSRATNEPKDDLVKRIHDEHAGDANGYQSDQPELTGTKCNLVCGLWHHVLVLILV